MVKQRVTYLQSRFISCSRQSKVFTYFIIVRAIRRAPVVQSVESAAVQWLHSRASQQQRTLARGQTTQQRAIRTKTFCLKKKKSSNITDDFCERSLYSQRRENFRPANLFSGESNHCYCSVLGRVFGVPRAPSRARDSFVTRPSRREPLTRSSATCDHLFHSAFF